MENLKERIDIVIETLAETSWPMAETVKELWTEYEKAEAWRNEAVKTLLQCRTAMLEAERDFHGKSVLFSTSFLNQVAALERLEVGK